MGRAGQRARRSRRGLTFFPLHTSIWKWLPANAISRGVECAAVMFVPESAHSDSWVNGAPVSITALHFRSMPERPLRGPAGGVQGSHCRRLIVPLFGGLPVVAGALQEPPRQRRQARP